MDGSRRVPKGKTQKVGLSKVFPPSLDVIARAVVHIYHEEQKPLLARIEALEKEVQALKAKSVRPL